MKNLESVDGVVVSPNGMQVSKTKKRIHLGSVSRPKSMIRFVVILIVCVVFSGVSKCQKDYVLFQTPSPSPSPTASPSPTPTASASPTPTPDDSTTDGETVESPTSTSNSSAIFSFRSTNGFWAGLKSLGDGHETEVGGEAGDAFVSTEPSGAIQKIKSLSEIRRNGSTSASNWLGRLYDDEDEVLSDQDGDGYIDALELDMGTDELDPKSTPKVVITNLRARMSVVDADLDGAQIQEESSLGTSTSVQDSDGDGFLDGSEMRSGTSPLDAMSFPIDTDGDGLGDDYEERVGLNPMVRDSDGDGLDDEMETIFGSDPLRLDSDSDGILDGREILLGSDPTISEVS